jgi:hypothetical protein
MPPSPPEADRVVADSAYGMAATAADDLCDADLRSPVVADFEAAGGALDVPTYFELRLD